MGTWGKFIWIFLFVLITSFKGGDVAYDSYVYKGWKCEQKGNFGSFWWKVDRTTYKHNGYYYYYVYFFSNSKINQWNYSTEKYPHAVTYIENVSVAISIESYGIKQVPYTLTEPYFVVDYQDRLFAYFYAEQGNANFSIYYGGVSPYDYSVR